MGYLWKVPESRDSDLFFEMRNFQQYNFYFRQKLKQNDNFCVKFSRYQASSALQIWSWFNEFLQNSKSAKQGSYWACFIESLHLLCFLL